MSYVNSTFIRETELTAETPQSNYNCLTEQSLINLKADLNKLEKLSEKRLEQMKSEILFSNKPECEISVQDYQLFQKYLILIEAQLRSVQGVCFDSGLSDRFNDVAKNRLKDYTYPELDLISRILTRNNVRCGENKGKNQEILAILELEKERRIYETVPKTIEERSRLDLLSEEENIKQELNSRRKSLPNQTLSEISTAYSSNITGLLDDLLSPKEDLTMSENLIEAFKKDDRLLYFGVTVVSLSVLLMVVK